MTTVTWSSGNSHTSDAEFRAWGSELSAKLAAVGLIQTADTGQINWTTVTRPGVSTDAGYEIWRFDDSMQSTAPIFLKFFYGTGSTASVPRIRVDVGTASDGAGGLSGVGSGDIHVCNGYNTASGNSTASPSYLCYADGFLGLVWKLGVASQGYLLLCRSCDADGDPTADGYSEFAYGTPSGSSLTMTRRHVRFASPASVIHSTVHGSGEYYASLVPGFLNPTTLPSGDKQVYLSWGAFPDMRPLFGLCAARITEFAAGTTFSAALVGSTARTYLAVGIVGNNYAAGSSSYTPAMLWE